MQVFFVNMAGEFTPFEIPPPSDDSGVGITAESSQCTQDVQQGKGCGDQSAMKVVFNKGLPFRNVHFDAERKEQIIDYHQQNCTHNVHGEAAHATIPAEGRDKPPVECSDKCHRGVLVLSRQF